MAFVERKSDINRLIGKNNELDRQEESVTDRHEQSEKDVNRAKQTTGREKERQTDREFDGKKASY